MLAVVPLLSYVILAFRLRHFGWRRSILFASIPWSLFLALITEGLSAVHLLTRFGVSIPWLIFALMCSVSPLPAAGQTEPGEPSQKLAPSVLGLRSNDPFALYFLCVIAGLIGVTALVSAPNTWDVMEYHMPRVVEWIANRGVQLYPTIDRQQLSMPPMAEYIMLHFDLLYGGDRLVNMVQWFSFVGCMLAVSVVVEELGGDRRAQVFAAVLSATLPTAVLGASGAKNDQVLAYWITLAVYFLLRWKVSQDWPHTLALATTLTLAVFTKGTAYAFLPFLVLACAMTWTKAGIRRFVLRLPVFALVFLAVNAPLWARNHAFSGSILGLPYFDGAGTNESRAFANSHITPARTLANAARNVALHAGVPSSHINAYSTRVFARVIRALGVDPNDPGQIVIGQSGLFRPFAVDLSTRNEVQTGNPLHLVLFLLAGVLYLANFSKMNRSVGWLGLGIIGAFLLYSALLRWSPFNARYQLPIFVIAAVFSALVLAQALPRWVTTGISFLLLILALPLAVMGASRPLLTKAGLKGSILTMSRERTYFLDQHENIADAFIDAARSVRAENCRSIGVDAKLLHFEYPMFALLNEDGIARHLSYASVDNPTEIYRPKSAPPCTVVCLNCAQSPQKWHLYEAMGLNMASTYDSVVVFQAPGSSLPVTVQTPGPNLAPAK